MIADTFSASLSLQAFTTKISVRRASRGGSRVVLFSSLVAFCGDWVRFDRKHDFVRRLPVPIIQSKVFFEQCLRTEPEGFPPANTLRHWKHMSISKKFSEPFSTQTCSLCDTWKRQTFRWNCLQRYQEMIMSEY